MGRFLRWTKDPRLVIFVILLVGVFVIAGFSHDTKFNLRLSKSDESVSPDSLTTEITKASQAIANESSDESDQPVVNGQSSDIPVTTVEPPKPISKPPVPPPMDKPIPHVPPPVDEIPILPRKKICKFPPANTEVICRYDCLYQHGIRYPCDPCSDPRKMQYLCRLPEQPVL